MLAPYPAHSLNQISNDLGIPPDSVKVGKTLVPGITQIEDLLDRAALDVIKTRLQIAKSPSKAEILRFFQERLASGNMEPLSDRFINNATVLLTAIKSRMKS